MKNLRTIFPALLICALFTFSSCENTNKEGSKDDMYKEGEHGDTLNNMNNGGNYTPDERNDATRTDTPATEEIKHGE